MSRRDWGCCYTPPSMSAVRRFFIAGGMVLGLMLLLALVEAMG